jgi:hypothetical protein
MSDDPTLTQALTDLASDIEAIAGRLDAATKRMAEIASRVWDAKLLTPPAGSGVRPKLYTVTLEAARRLASRGERLTKTRLFEELRDVECLSIKDHEKDPLWEYVTGGGERDTP